MTHEKFLQKLPELIKNYRPAPEVLEHIRSVTLLMLIGPTGAGKTTLINHLGFKLVPSDTTRRPRSGEQEGIDFYFRTDYNQIASEIKAARFVQVAIGPAGDFYATRASSYPHSGTAVMPIVADVIPIFRRLGFAKTTSAFIVPPTYEEWMRRIAAHPASEEQLTKRLAEARRSFEFALSDREVHFILSDNIEPGVKQLKDLLSNQIDTGREAKARQIAESLLTTLA